MNLRFFADQCVPNSIIKALIQEGYIVFKLRDYMPQDSEDFKVISKAQELDAILLSLNGDFADIITYPPSRYKGIIAIQLRNHPEVIPLIIRHLNVYLSLYPNMDHYRGKLFLVEPHRIRIKK
ncbi:MAG: DUF5615 family PIN-like protein [bacterium]|nr:DUF5615 family PIN-like protein [bacterium]